MSKPAGTTAVANTTIESAKFNSVIDDIITDLNAPRPIVAGGTGASTAAGILAATGVTASVAEVNILDGATVTTDELNVLDGIPATLTATELGYLDGVTSPIQTQLDAKLESISDGSVTFAKLAAAAVITASETIASNDSDVAVPTAAAVKDYADSVVGGTTIGINTTIGAATVGPWDLPAGVKKFTITSNKSSLSGTGHIIVQLRVSAAFVTSGYDSRSLAGTSGNITSTSGMCVAIGTATDFWDGAMDFWLHNPATNLWLCRHTGSKSSSPDLVGGSGSIALAGAIDGVQINSTAGTFDVSSFNVHY